MFSVLNVGEEEALVRHIKNKNSYANVGKIVVLLVLILFFMYTIYMIVFDFS